MRRGFENACFFRVSFPQFVSAKRSLWKDAPVFVCGTHNAHFLIFSLRMRSVVCWTARAFWRVFTKRICGSFWGSLPLRIGTFGGMRADAEQTEVASFLEIPTKTVA